MSADTVAISTTPDRAEETLQVVAFRVAHEKFAIDILQIVGIERLEQVLHLPHMPAFLEGVMRIRDEIVPLVRLRTRFGFPERDYDAGARVILIDLEEESIGFIVDSVDAVQRFTRGQLETAPALALTTESRFVRGVLRTAGSMLILLDPAALLGEDDKRLLHSAVADDGTLAL